MSDMQMRRDDFPEQRMADPSLSIGEYASDYRQEFRECIQKVFKDIAGAAWRSEEIDTSGLTRRALDGFERYFQTMKGATNLSENRVSEGVLWQIQRQQTLHNLMRETAGRFESLGVRFEVTDTGYYPTQTMWRFEMEPGCGISIDGRPLLIAFPPANVRTYDYLVPRSGPVAWQVTHVNEDGVILAPWHEDCGERFGKAAAGVWPAGEVIGISSPMNIHLTLSYGDYLYISLISDIDLCELDDILGKTGVPWVVAGNPFNFEGVIYNGKPDEVPFLLKEIMPGPVF